MGKIETSCGVIFETVQYTFSRYSWKCQDVPNFAFTHMLGIQF
jgi:hypothetical protein